MIETEGFEPQEGTQGQTDGVALGASQAGLGLFEATKLLDGAMIGFDVPGVLGKAQAGKFVHIQVVGGPVFNAAVCGNDLEDEDQAIALEVDLHPLLAERGFSEARCPWPSGLSSRLLFKRVNRRQPKRRRCLRLSSPLYQLSKTTPSGIKPRLCATCTIVWKWSFLLKPSLAFS